MAAVRDCGFELVDNPPYSPDLAPSDHFLFPTRKNTWLGSSIGPINDVISAVEDIFEDQDESFYTTGIQALQHQWKKCEDSRGEYVEKKNTHSLVKFVHCIIVNLWTFQPTLVYCNNSIDS